MEFLHWVSVREWLLFSMEPLGHTDFFSSLKQLHQHSRPIAKVNEIRIL